jgi:acyl-CoA synthetase (AMP-forming)/AMP-acid ligase II
MSQPPRIGSLLEAAVAQSPQRPALVYADTVLTYERLHAAVERLAARLGERSGERVAVIAPNVPALAVALFAAWRSGATAVPLSARLRGFELRRVFADAQPTAAISLAAHGGFSLADELRALGEQTPAMNAAILVDELGEPREEMAWPAGAAARPLDPVPTAIGLLPHGDHDPPPHGDVAAIMYTSGTTGEPKGALMSHALGVAEGRQLAELLGDRARGASVLVTPASHAYGLGCLLCCVSAGGHAVLVDSTTTLEPLAAAVRRHGARVLHGTPALFARLLRATAELPLRSGFTAGSACPPGVLEELDRRGTRILNMYGMTEIGAASCCRAEDPPEVRHHTVGRPLPGYEFRVVDAPEEIEVRGPYVTAGYHGRPRAREDAFDGEWFRTGDLGAIDAAGNLSIAGRAKEVVHVGGFNVFPAEVESFLLTHPAIGQASVLGVPHTGMGETLHAFVVPAPHAGLRGRDVVRFARAGIAGYKVPYGVTVVPELPLLPSGKPDRRALARVLQPRGAELH